jgi:hypothetical protein
MTEDPFQKHVRPDRNAHASQICISGASRKVSLYLFFRKKLKLSAHPIDCGDFNGPRSCEDQNSEHLRAIRAQFSAVLDAKQFP